MSACIHLPCLVRFPDFLHPSLTARLPAAFDGSHRAYYAWRWPLLSRPLGRLLVEWDAEGREITTIPVPDSLVCHSSAGGGGEGPAAKQNMPGQVGPQGTGLPGDAAAASAVRVAAAAMAAVYVEGEVMVQQATWSPAGALLAFTEMRADRGPLLESRVVVADGRSGRRLGSWVLASPFPPFYYMWAACGTRLLFLRCAGAASTGG